MIDSAFDYYIENNALFLTYESGLVEAKLNQIRESGSANIKYTFFFNEANVKVEDEYTITICIGTVVGDYVCLDKDVFRINHNFYFDKTIHFNTRLFVASYNYSIINNIDNIIEEDLYIGGKQEESIPYEIYNSLVKHFPKTSELKKYVNYRIASVLKEFLPQTEKYEVDFNNYIQKKNNKIAQLITNGEFYKDAYVRELQLAQLLYIRDEIRQLMRNADGIPESDWQKIIHELIRPLFPKYIFAFREFQINGFGKGDKRPDFLLIDANGYVDVMEIKKPNTIILATGKYRSNYVPTKELSGSIQQIEKYCHYLAKWGEAGEAAITKKYKNHLPDDFTIQIVNPQGILLLGDTTDFNKTQTADFELIKRQYKNITEVITYDDLLGRLDNMIEVLQRK